MKSVKLDLTGEFYITMNVPKMLQIKNLERNLQSKFSKYILKVKRMLECVFVQRTYIYTAPFIQII